MLSYSSSRIIPQKKDTHKIPKKSEKKDTHKILPVFGEKGVPSLYSRRYEPAVFSILNSRLIAPALRSHFRRGMGV
jgi:hypothetical protein